MITALIAGLLVVLVNRSDHQLRLVVHRFRFDRHVDSDLSQQLKVTEVSSNRIAGRHFYLLFWNHHQAANHEGRLVVVPLNRNFRSLIHSSMWLVACMSSVSFFHLAVPARSRGCGHGRPRRFRSSSKDKSS